MYVRQLSKSFTRPDNATAYADNDLVANDTTAANVVPLEFDLGNAGNHIVAIRIEKSDETDVTSADFSINLYGSLPTPANGDNGAVSTDIANKLGTIDVGAMVAATDDAFCQIHYGETGFLQGLYTGTNKVYALLEANAAYTPAAEEVFTVYLTFVSF
jgi:hypothetical protein